VAHQFEAADEMGDVELAACKEIVDAEDIVARIKEPFAQVRAQKAGAASDEYSLHNRIPLRVRECDCVSHP
jgi:hypothetical protein